MFNTNKFICSVIESTIADLIMRICISNLQCQMETSTSCSFGSFSIVVPPFVFFIIYFLCSPEFILHVSRYSESIGRLSTV